MVATVVFLSSDDVQISIVDLDVFTSVSVVLEFVVTKTTISNVDSPFASVETVSVEVISECLNPFLTIDSSQTEEGNKSVSEHIKHF